MTAALLATFEDILEGRISRYSLSGELCLIIYMNKNISDWVSLFTGLDYWSHLFATKNHFYDE